MSGILSKCWLITPKVGVSVGKFDGVRLKKNKQSLTAWIGKVEENGISLNITIYIFGFFRIVLIEDKD